MDQTSPQTVNADDYIKSHPLYIPFQNELFYTDVNPDYMPGDEVRPSCIQIDGNDLPPMREVETTDSIIHSGKRKPSQKSKEVPPRVLVKDKYGVLVEGKSCCYIVVTTRKPRASRAAVPKKAAPSERSAPKNNSSKKKKTASTTESALVVRPPRSVELADSVEEVEPASESDVAESDSIESDGAESDSDTSVVSLPDPVYSDGDVVRNIHNLHGKITACYGDGPHRVYDVLYKDDGRFDKKVRGKFLRTLPTRRPIEKGASTAGRFELVLVPEDDEWEDGNVKAKNVIVGKRKSAAVKYSN